MGDGEPDGPRARLRLRAAVCLCCCAALTVAAALIVAGNGGAPTGRQARTADARSGIVPIAQSVVNQAAAYWRDKLAPPRPTVQERAAPPGSSSAPRSSEPPAPVAAGPSAAPSSATPATAAAPPPAAAVSDPLTGSPFTGLPQVGAIFATSDGSPAGHFCTGSVVASPRGNLVVTAAHCVYDASSGTYARSIAFVPGYHDSQAPYGVWALSTIVVDPRWPAASDPDYDVAFLVVQPDGSGRQVQDVVGGDTLGVNGSATALTRVVGYPSTTEQPISCTNYTKPLSPTQLEFDCAAFPDGTSGGPFLTGVDPVSGLGTVTGVVGGYQYGGDSADVSYSPYFGDAVENLYARAESVG